MNSFSIIPSYEVDIVDQYTDFLSRELNKDLWFANEEDIHNPLLLQQIAVMRATRIQKTIETNGSVLYQGLRYTNDTIRNSSVEITRKMAEIAPVITSSLSRGFTAMHHSLGILNEGIMQTNEHLGNIQMSIGNLSDKMDQSNQQLRHLSFATMRGMSALLQTQQVANQHLQTINQSMVENNQRLLSIDQTISTLSGMMGQWFAVLCQRLNATHTVLQSVLEELRIPESQRERRYHIEEGTKYLAMALTDNDKFYYEDAISEFEQAIKLERKDFYSWYSLGFIYLRSVNHIDIKKAIDALERFVHYARAEAVQCNNQPLKLKLDDAYLMLAEAHYLLKEPKDAIKWTDKCVNNKEKALLMKVKYLSFIANAETKNEAATILRDLLMQNPFLSLQVLEDVDMIQNDYIKAMLKKLTAEIRTEAKSRLTECREVLLKNISANGIVEICKKKLDKVAKLIERNTLLESFEALYLLNFSFQKTINGYNIKYNLNGVTFDMVYVKGGTYEMGYGIETHTVTVSDFFLCESAVTQELWVEVMGYNPTFFGEQNPQFPISNISWEDCQLFISKLNQLTESRFRLPTEAEWEYAARGGNKSREFKFAGSNDYDKVAWLRENSSGHIHCVKQKLPNDLGLYDMSGNVNEWCQDWYEFIIDKYRSHEVNPTGPKVGERKAMRGGSCYYNAQYGHIKYRHNEKPESKSGGLRLAL